MNPASASIHELRPRIIERRARLQAASASLPAGYVNELLNEIDAALEKIDRGVYGLCETCRDPIEAGRLERNPLARFCLDHLTAVEVRAHEQDLQLATEIQERLLPARQVTAGNWEAHYAYQPAGVVGGDYCELIALHDGRSLFFALGDVTGKGVAASLLMTHLSAIFRSLVSLNLSLGEILMRANRLFAESTPETHFATLAAGLATDVGVDLCNAGHCAPILLSRKGTERIEATGLPLGLFPSAPYGIRHIALEPGDTLVLFSDGVTEAADSEDRLFDEERLLRSLAGRTSRDPAAIIAGVLEELSGFRGRTPQQDDMTLMVVRRL